MHVCMYVNVHYGNIWRVFVDKIPGFYTGFSPGFTNSIFHFTGFYTGFSPGFTNLKFNISLHRVSRPGFHSGFSGFHSGFHYGKFQICIS